MTTSADHLGPIDYAVIEFDGNHFHGEVATAILRLISEGTIRVLDLAVVTKGADGSVEIIEIEDVDEAGDLHGLAEFIADVVSDEDLIAIAEILEPNTTALLAVWENVWALELAQAVRSAGGQWVGGGRVPAPEIIAALEAAGA